MIAIAVVVTTLVNQTMFGPAEADSEESGTLEVRISARRGHDGRVEFALQQHDGDTWSERIAPRQRFFPTTARVDHWLNSTAIELEAPAQPSEPMPMLCVVANGDPNKLFWRFTALHTQRAATSNRSS